MRLYRSTFLLFLGVQGLMCLCFDPTSDPVKASAL